MEFHVSKRPRCGSAKAGSQNHAGILHRHHQIARGFGLGSGCNPVVGQRTNRREILEERCIGEELVPFVLAESRRADQSGQVVQGVAMALETSLEGETAVLDELVQSLEIAVVRVV